ncbi:acetylxylan esterase [Arthrobacter alpinus]|nr:acetylxylan esterase [Arthrobacter alpinus]
MLAVLNYYDGVHLARRCAVPALYSAAGMDDVCPASGVYASFNGYGSEAPAPPAKEMEYYRFNNHEGGQEHTTGSGSFITWPICWPNKFGVMVLA